METKNKEKFSSAEESAFDQGLDLAELLGHFVYFLQETPEGREAKKVLEQDWQASCQKLRNKKQIKGRNYSFLEWLRLIYHQLLVQSTPVVMPRHNKKKKYKKKAQQFKNIN